MIALALALAAASPNVDKACIAHGELVSAMVYAHAKGVPLSKTLEILPMFDEPYRTTVRKSIMVIYSHAPEPVTFNQQRYADKIAIACMEGADERD